MILKNLLPMFLLKWYRRKSHRKVMTVEKTLFYIWTMNFILLNVKINKIQLDEKFYKNYMEKLLNLKLMDVYAYLLEDLILRQLQWKKEIGENDDFIFEYF